MDLVCFETWLERVQAFQEPTDSCSEFAHFSQRCTQQLRSSIVGELLLDLSDILRLHTTLNPAKKKAML